MNGSKFDAIGDSAKRRDSLYILTKALKKGNAFKLGVASILAIIGTTGGAWIPSAFANPSAPVAVLAPWTTPDGRNADELRDDSRSFAHNKNFHIRQTSAVVQDDLLNDATAIPQYDGALEDPAQYSDTSSVEEELLDPSADLQDVSDSAIEDIPDTAVAPVATPLSNASSASSLAPASEAPKTSPSSLSTDIEKYPQGNVGNNSGANRKRTFSSAASNAPSTNPYSRIGQAEYNPNQFYGGGGNYSVNGYRNTPPAFAYGQSVCGGEGCDDCGCGVFGGILRNTQLQINAFNMRSPLDFTDTGNTGADFAINWGSARPVLFGLNVQAGARAAFSDYYGTEANGFSYDDSRNQIFWTAGTYFRAPACSDGWSGGVVYDTVIENYYREYELNQLRAELSYNFSGFCEIGFRGAFGLNDDRCEFFNIDQDLYVDAKATASSYYTMFIRKRFMEGAELTVAGGVTEWGEGLIAATAEAPLSDSFALRGSAGYVFPNKRDYDKNVELIRDELGFNHKRLEESWNLSVGLTWYIGGNARNGCDSQRPLFDVADNGSFLQNFLR